MLEQWVNGFITTHVGTPNIRVPIEIVGRWPIMAMGLGMLHLSVLHVLLFNKRNMSMFLELLELFYVLLLPNRFKNLKFLDIKHGTIH